MKIRQGRIEDARAIAEVQVGTWQSAYRGIVDQDYLDSLSVENHAEQWKRTLRGKEIAKQHGTPIQVAVTENCTGTVDGFVVWCQCQEVDGGDVEDEVLAIYVMEEVQGKGRGRALLDAVWASEERPVALIARTLEAGAARAFYEAVGGVVVGRDECRIGGKGYPSVCYRMVPNAAFDGDGGRPGRRRDA